MSGSRQAFGNWLVALVLAKGPSGARPRLAEAMREAGELGPVGLDRQEQTLGAQIFNQGDRARAPLPSDWAARAIIHRSGSTTARVGSASPGNASICCSIARCPLDEPRGPRARARVVWSQREGQRHAIDRSFRACEGSAHVRRPR